MDRPLIDNLVIITNSIIHMHISATESYDTEELSDNLKSTQRKHENSLNKQFEAFGGKPNGRGGYDMGESFNKHQELNKAIAELNELDIPCNFKLKILSKKAIDTQKKYVPFNTHQINLMREYLMIQTPKEDNEEDT